jgi:putative nucleotidyltransferase with HDIG domain
MGTSTLDGGGGGSPVPLDDTRARVVAVLEGRRDQLARHWSRSVENGESRWPDLERYLRSLISGLTHVLRSDDWTLTQSVIDELAQRRHASGIAIDQGVQRALLAGRHAVRPLWGEGTGAADCEDLFLETLHECVLRFSESYQGLRMATESDRMHTRIIKSLVMSLEARDPYTKGHSLSVAILAQRMADAIDEVDSTRVYLAGLLHDVGKIGIPDAILLKPGPLTAAEWEVMKSHSSVGANILKPIKLYSEVTSAVLTHHENHDGSGYPLGLAGDDIPVIARILRVADSFDAMTTTRTHRAGKPVEEAIEVIAQGSGILYHPAMADLFAQIIQAPGAINELSLASLQIDLEEFVL